MTRQGAPSQTRAKNIARDVCPQNAAPPPDVWLRPPRYMSDTHQSRTNTVSDGGPTKWKVAAWMATMLAISQQGQLLNQDGHQGGVAIRSRYNPHQRDYICRRCECKLLTMLSCCSDVSDEDGPEDRSVGICLVLGVRKPTDAYTNSRQRSQPDTLAHYSYYKFCGCEWQGQIENSRSRYLQLQAIINLGSVLGGLLGSLLEVDEFLLASLDACVLHRRVDCVVNRSDDCLDASVLACLCPLLRAGPASRRPSRLPGRLPGRLCA